MTTEQKFSAAVSVIRNLPKNGSFQPSTDLQLKFYAYFKQATEGPNTKSKPSFWDLPGQVKWTAWKKLGNMTKEDAMNSYVEELKSIVETMSYNVNVETFLASLGAFYDSVPAKDVDLVLGPVIEKVKSGANSPLTSRDSSPRRITNGEMQVHDMELYSDIDESSPASTSNGTLPLSPQSSPYKSDSGAHWNGAMTSTADSDDDDEFTDPMETTPQPVRKFVPRSSLGDGLPLYASNTSMKEDISEPLKIVQITVKQLQKDLDNLTTRVRLMETAAQKESKRTTRQVPSRDLLQWRNFSIPTRAFIVLWPIAVHYILNYLRNKKSK